MLAGYKDKETDTYLLVKLHKGWLKLLLNVSTKVVWVLVVRVRPACIVLVLWGKVDGWSWYTVEWNICVLCISDFFKFDVRNFLVTHDGWVMGHDVTW